MISIILLYLLCSVVGFAFFYLSNNINYRAAIIFLVSCLFILLINYFSLIALLLMTSCTYFISLKMVKEKKNEYIYFYVGITLNIIAFLGYKFFEDFVFPNPSSILDTGFKVSNWIVIGIGYYTLQNVGYLISVKKNKQIIESLTFFLISISFFKILSGPIIDPYIFKKQIKNIVAPFNREFVIAGFQRILLGIAKKIIIADRLATFVNSNYIISDNVPGWEVLVACITFTLQLYFDFSGYIDIAIGSAKLFGIEIPENFNMPFRSKSISEFWRKWHITLISWFTTNIFYPFNFKYRSLGKIAVVYGFALTFLVSAIWHGLGFTYLAWAACHIIYLFLDVVFKKNKNIFSNIKFSKIKSYLLVAFTFLLVSISNIFFRAGNINIAISMFKNLFNVKKFFPYFSDFKTWLISGAGNIELVFNLRLGLVLALLFLIFEKRILNIANAKYFNWKYFVAIVFLICFLGIFDSATRFIYMQF